MPLPSLRALVVDDEESVRLITANALSAENINCDLAGDGTAAAALLARSHYDIVVTDLKMPNGHGHALCRSILDRPNRPVVAVITGIEEPRLMRDLALRGVDATFRKPLDLKTFGKQVRSLYDARCAAGVSRNGEQPVAERTLAEQPDGERIPASGLPRAELPRRPTVAILLGDPIRAGQLAAALATEKLRVFVPETTDSLCRFVEKQRLDVILIEDARYGFLSGAEILARIQSGANRAEAVMIAEPITLAAEQMQSLNVRTLFSGGATDSDLIQSVRSALADRERIAAKISPEARALVRSHGAPSHSPLLLLKLSNYLQMRPADIPFVSLTRDILSSPATTGELLRLSNGSSVGMRRPITEVGEALAFLGIGRAVSLLLASGVRSLERGLAQRIPPDLLAWYQLRSILIATVSSVFAERHFDVSGDTAFILGLFQDMGILVLGSAFGDRYWKLIEHARTVGPVRLHAIEQQYFHISHPQVSAALIDLWQLPEKLVEPVRLHHDSGALAAGRDELTAFIQAMRIGEAFADLWENRHPTRNDAMSRLLAECPPASHADYRQSLEEAVRRSADYSKLFRIPHPDQNAALDVCKEILAAYSDLSGEPLAAGPAAGSSRDAARHAE